ncbi:MAG: winged helix DNA-binding protein [Bacteroidales bacterium]|nr:winged helix DNA-binding protein [Bacteroidales bacterium]
MENLCKLRDLQRAIARFEISFEKEYGICFNEGMLLCSLAKNEKLSSGELSEILGLTCSNTSKVIASVEKKYLIHRVMGLEDKRQMYFSLTDKGLSLLGNIKCEYEDMPELLKRVL